ncbi:MAG TPA: hypothetical protein VN706_02125 [Gemmatimonadaceae bacterium]|nr:hypothetical protein [Gemmatimonadaceae bacterium]
MRLARSIVLTTAAVSIAACAERRARNTPPASLRALLTVDTSVSPDAWMRSHPADSLRSDAPSWDVDAECLVAIGNDTIEGLVVRHAAVFDPPMPPRDFTLDADTTRFAERHCRLRAVVIRVVGSDSTRSIIALDSLQRVFGAVDPDYHVLIGRVLRVRNTLRVYGADDPHGMIGTVFPSADRPGALLDSMLHIAGDDSLREAAVVAERISHDSVVTADSDSVVVRAIRILSTDTAHRTAEQRAAALRSADLMMSLAASQFFAARDSVGRARSAARRATYEHLGAVYWNDEPDAMMEYSHNVRRAAYAAAPRSRAGQSALLAALFDGVTVDSTGDTRKPRFVIDAGERALATHAADTAMVHLALAQAYADVYAIAHGGYGELVDSTEYARDYPDAHQRAIAHGRAAIASLTDPARRAQAWMVTFDAILGRRDRLYYPFIND